ncbi:MAG: PEGA domain-containing protein, partial [Myxococcota bacterium]
LSLSLGEAKGPTVAGRVDLVWRSPAEAMVTVVGPSVDRLFGGPEADRFTGALEVFAAPGTAVTVDGVSHGVTPLGTPIGGLPIGVHVVQLSRDGFMTRRPDVVIAKNETTLLRVELEPEPLHRQWWFWAALGSAAATAVAGGTAIAWWLMPQEAPKTEVILGTASAVPLP